MSEKRKTSRATETKPAETEAAETEAAEQPAQAPKEAEPRGASSDRPTGKAKARSSLAYGPSSDDVNPGAPTWPSS